MKIHRLVRIAVATLLSCSALLVISVPSAFAATTLTWTGSTACTNNPSVAADCGFSNATNWGGTTFANGDDVIFPNSLIATANPIVDTADTVGSITFTGDATSGTPELGLAAALTVDGDITQDSSVTGTLDVIEDTGTPQTITLGANVTVSANYNLVFGDTSTNDDTIALGGNKLSFTNSASSQGITVNDTISGTGTVDFNTAGADTGVFLSADNTYSGVSNIQTGAVEENGASGNNAFGTSTINVATAGSVSFLPATASITNPIVVAGTTDGSPVTSLSFNNLGTSASSLSVPNISLNGNTRFANESSANSALSIDVTGINAGSYCVDYLGLADDNSQAGSGFSGGPNYCTNTASTAATTTTTAATPGTPDTGLAANRANPIVVLAVTTLAAATIFIIARRLKPVPIKQTVRK